VRRATIDSVRRALGVPAMPVTAADSAAMRDSTRARRDTDRKPPGTSQPQT
jgi:hypothetical protein